jgi:hypothetical protein
MTLTISQLQHMYGTNSVQTLRGANPLTDPVQTKNVTPSKSDSSSIHDHTVHSPETPDTSFPEGINLMLLSPEQRGELFKKQAAEELAKLEAKKASLPPRIKGALGEDLRLRYDLDTANFLEEMKVKYTHVKDAFSDPIVPPDYESYDERYPNSKMAALFASEQREAEKNARKMYNIFGDFTGYAPTEAEERERTGNGFVMTLLPVVSHISSYLARMASNAEGVKNATRDLQAGNAHPGLREQIAQQQAFLDQARKEIKSPLEYLKNITDKRGFATEIAQYFADYSRFETGTAYDLNAVYREAGII